jgi:hypothetical protein
MIRQRISPRLGEDLSTVRRDPLQGLERSLSKNIQVRAFRLYFAALFSMTSSTSSREFKKLPETTSRSHRSNFKKSPR